MHIARLHFFLNFFVMQCLMIVEGTETCSTGWWISECYVWL